MKKILVLVQNYPDNDGGVALMYAHVRNKYYIQHDIDVTVLNFSSHDDYNIDNIKVITEDTYKKENKKYSCISDHPHISSICCLYFCKWKRCESTKWERSFYNKSCKNRPRWNGTGS